MAASFAREGFVGATHPIEGKYGFLNAYAPSPDAKKAVAAIGSVWETMNIAVKPYPGCRLAHSAVDAIIELRREHQFQANEIESVVIGLAGVSYDLTGAPEAQKRTPDNLVDAQFSVHFQAAIALQYARIQWDDFSRLLRDKATAALMGKISVIRETNFGEDDWSKFRARVSIELQDGRQIVRQVDLPKGEFGNFLTNLELRAKFRSLVAPCIGQAGEIALYDLILNFENETVDNLFRRTMPAPDMLMAGED